MLVCIRPRLGGVQLVYRFPNGYGASVIKTPVTGPGWELAVLQWNGQRARPVYDTPVTGDVEPGLSWEEVKLLIKQIEQLPPLGRNRFSTCSPSNPPR